MIVSLYIIKLDFEIVYIKSNLLSFDFLFIEIQYYNFLYLKIILEKK
jgi:hypothetical protein